jgi:hypothetical protein
VTMKNAVFLDVAPSRSYVNQRFGGTYRLHLQGRKNPPARNQREHVAADSSCSHTGRLIKSCTSAGALYLMLLHASILLTFKVLKLEIIHKYLSSRVFGQLL